MRINWALEAFPATTCVALLVQQATGIIVIGHVSLLFLPPPVMVAEGIAFSLWIDPYLVESCDM